MWLLWWKLPPRPRRFKRLRPALSLCVSVVFSISSLTVVVRLQFASVLGAFSSETLRKPDILVEDGDTVGPKFLQPSSQEGCHYVIDTLSPPQCTSAHWSTPLVLNSYWLDALPPPFQMWFRSSLTQILQPLFSPPPTLLPTLSDPRAHKLVLMYSTCAWEDIWTRPVMRRWSRTGCAAALHMCHVHRSLIFDEQVEIFMTTPLS